MEQLLCTQYSLEFREQSVKFFKETGFMLTSEANLLQ